MPKAKNIALYFVKASKIISHCFCQQALSAADKAHIV
jgi:hypothetical protein